MRENWWKWATSSRSHWRSEAQNNSQRLNALAMNSWPKRSSINVRSFLFFDDFLHFKRVKLWIAKWQKIGGRGFHIAGGEWPCTSFPFTKVWNCCMFTWRWKCSTQMHRYYLNKRNSTLNWAGCVATNGQELAISRFTNVAGQWTQCRRFKDGCRLINVTSDCNSNKQINDNSKFILIWQIPKNK